MFWYLVFGILAILALAVVVSALYFQFQFRRSAAGRWKQSVVHLHVRAAQLRRQLADELRLLTERRGRDERAVWDQAFERYLQSIPVVELESYPRIGPGTVARIQEAGCQTIADLRRQPVVRSHGLGEKRLTDIRDAVLKLSNDAWARLQAGGCPEAKGIPQKLAEIRTAFVASEASCQARWKACDALLAELKPQFDAARRVTLWRFVADQKSLLASEWLQQPLPDLDARVQQAEEQARRDQELARPVGEAIRPAAAAPAGETWMNRGAAPVDLFSPASAHVADGPSSAPPPDDLEKIVQFAYAVARSDGRVAKRERDVIARFITKRSGEDPAGMRRAAAHCARYETAAIDLEKCLQAVGIGRNEGERKELYALAEAIADAAGPRNAREIEFLERVAWALGLNRAAAAAVPVEPSPSRSPAAAPTREQHLQALEIAATTPLSADLVRRQYNLLSMKLAPEKLAGLGAEFQAMADAKRAAIRAAALALLEPFGEPLEKDPPAAQDLRHNPELDAMFSV